MRKRSIFTYSPYMVGALMALVFWVSFSIAKHTYGYLQKDGYKYYVVYRFQTDSGADVFSCAVHHISVPMDNTESFMSVRKYLAEHNVEKPDDVLITSLHYLGRVKMED